MAATVTDLRAPTTRGGRRPVTVADAVADFLASARCHESAHTHRAYASALHRAAEHLDGQRFLADVDDHEIGDALTALWGCAAATTWNRNRAAVGSWLTWCSTRAKWAAPVLPGTTPCWWYAGWSARTSTTPRTARSTQILDVALVRHLTDPTTTRRVRGSRPPRHLWI